MISPPETSAGGIVPQGCLVCYFSEGKSTVQSSLKVQDLAERIESLEPEERLELLRRVVTPELELRLLVEDLQKKVSASDPRALARDVNRTVREVRSRRSLSPTPRTQ